MVAPFAAAADDRDRRGVRIGAKREQCCTPGQRCRCSVRGSIHAECCGSVARPALRSNLRSVRRRPHQRHRLQQVLPTAQLRAGRDPLPPLQDRLCTGSDPLWFEVHRSEHGPAAVRFLRECLPGRRNLRARTVLVRRWPDDVWRRLRRPEQRSLPLWGLRECLPGRRDLRARTMLVSGRPGVWWRLREQRQQPDELRLLRKYLHLGENLRGGTMCLSSGVDGLWDRMCQPEQRPQELHGLRWHLSVVCPAVLSHLPSGLIGPALLPVLTPATARARRGPAVIAARGGRGRVPPRRAEARSSSASGVAAPAAHAWPCAAPCRPDPRSSSR